MMTQFHSTLKPFQKIVADAVPWAKRYRSNASPLLLSIRVAISDTIQKRQAVRLTTRWLAGQRRM